MVGFARSLVIPVTRDAMPSPFAPGSNPPRDTLSLMAVPSAAGPEDFDQIGNISARGFVGRDDTGALVADFAVSGSGPREFLIRGIGPTLAGFGVERALARPHLTVRNATHGVVGENEVWSDEPDPAALADAARRAGGFPLSTRHRDAAMLMTLPPGRYRVDLSTADHGAGIGLIEVYDVERDAPRIHQFACRGPVIGGDQVLIAGVNVTGRGRRTFLVRALGPALAERGEPEPLADPVLSHASDLVYPLTLTASTTRDPAIVAAALGATGVAPLRDGQHDVLVARLSPASYSFRIGSAGNRTGSALLQFWEVPAGIEVAA